MSDREDIPMKQHNTDSSKAVGVNLATFTRHEVASMDGHKKKHCDQCAKLFPFLSSTHNTIQCFKWNADGDENTRRTDSGRSSHREKSKLYSNTI